VTKQPVRSYNRQATNEESTFQPRMPGEASFSKTSHAASTVCRAWTQRIQLYAFLLLSYYNVDHLGIGGNGPDGP
jgi:hypothetical protein